MWRRGHTLVSAAIDGDLLHRELYTADPVREGNAYYPASATITAITGWPQSTSMSGTSPPRTGLPHVVGLRPRRGRHRQPAMRLTGSDGVHRYPDFMTLDADGRQTVYDVKPMARINSKVREQFDWTRAVCAQVGWGYRILTDPPPQFKVNLTWLGQFRHPGHHPAPTSRTRFSRPAQPDWTYP